MLNNNNLVSTLLANIFAGLINLETLRLNNNDLETPPMNIFASLTNLLTLDLSSNEFNTLSATTFSELTRLETLRLDANNISTLPATIFSGLTNLQILNMVNNPDTGKDYMFNLTLSRDRVNYAPSPASLSLQIAEGAPTALTFPIRVVTGTATVTDSAGNDITELTLAAGSTESDEFHVISTDVVAVGLDSAILPTGFTGTGVQFVVSDVLFLFSTVCDRTPEVSKCYCVSSIGSIRRNLLR